MKATLHHRNTCRLCNSEKIELVVKLEPIPLSENYSDNSDSGKNSERYPVDLYMCADCSHVQQLDVVDSKSLWEKYTYSSANAVGMLKYYEKIAIEIINKYLPNKGALVIDICSNDGSLLKQFKKYGYQVLGVDPSIKFSKLAEEEGIPTIIELNLMTLDLANKIILKHGKADLICIFDAFAHTDNMIEIAKSINKLLTPNGICVVEFQYLLDILEKNIIATVIHEHMSHHSILSLVSYLHNNNLELIDVKRTPNQYGSVIGFIQIKGAEKKIEHSVNNLLRLEKIRGLEKVETLKQFSVNIKKQRDIFQKNIKIWKSKGYSIAGYGAARSGPTLISQLGLKNSIEYIFDDHPDKVGKYSSGDGIKILPTAELYKQMPAYTIILAWVHSNKIIESNAEYLEKGGNFVVLCPNPRVVSKKGVNFLY